MKVTKEQYLTAQLEYETNPNCTFQQLGDELGVSHQAVSKRAKKEGWKKADTMQLEVAESMDIAQPTAGSLLGKRCPENIAKIINTYAISGNKKLTAGIVGIDRDTLLKWAKEDPELTAHMDAARKDHLVKQFFKIDRSPDWKAAKEILSRAPETKEQWGEMETKGPTIVLNILRE